MKTSIVFAAVVLAYSYATSSIMPMVVAVLSASFAVYATLWYAEHYRAVIIAGTLEAVQRDSSEDGNQRTSLLSKSACEMAANIRDGRVTSSDAVRASIGEVQRVDKLINAGTMYRFSEAIKEAFAADEELRITRDTASLPRFFGVPCTVKECIPLTGMPHTSGLLARNGTVADEDATVVARMRKAGLIPVASTNVSELCMWYESSNPVYGRTNNPYNTARIVGGSSGGEAAMIGSGASICGVGSDIGGSIRMPAFFCGIFGHKPTGGLVPGTGQHPNAQNAALRYLTTGPMCRSAGDLWPLLEVMAGPDGVDTECVDMPLAPRPTAGPWTASDTGDAGVMEEALSQRPSWWRDGYGWEDVTVYVVEDILKSAPKHTTPLDEFLEETMMDAASTVCERLGCKGPVPLPMPELVDAMEIWSAMLSDATDISFHERMEEGTPDLNIWKEIARSLTGESNFTLPALGLAAIETWPDRFMPGRQNQLRAAGNALRERMDALLGQSEDGPAVLLYPTHPTPAPVHDLPKFRVFNVAYTAIFNVLELPATAIPTGIHPRTGTPVGMQAVGGKGCDKLTIAVAEELDRLAGGLWVHPGDAANRAGVRVFERAASEAGT